MNTRVIAPQTTKSRPEELMTRAVVFDLDGTLVDSAPDLLVAANRLLAEEGQPPLEIKQLRGMVGEGVARLVARVFAAVDIELSTAAQTRYVERFREIYMQEVCRHTTFMPGAVDCLNALKDTHALALCTNKPLAHTRALVDGLQIADVFASIIGGDSLSVMKPDPAPLLKAVADAGASPAKSIYVGDSAIDCRTGAAAGIPVILVEGGYVREPIADLGAVAITHSLADVPRLVERLLDV